MGLAGTTARSPRAVWPNFRAGQVVVFVLCVCSIVAATSQVAYAISYGAPLNISKSDGVDDVYPDVSGRNVVWSDNTYPFNTYYWTVGDEEPIIIGSGGSGVAIDGDHVAFSGRGSASYRDIYSWHAGDNEAVNVTNGSGQENLLPDVSGSRIVWQGDGEIYTWSHGDPAPMNISNSPNVSDSWPQVSGDRVVWRGSDGANYGIYTWAVGSTEAVSLMTGSGLIGNPRISGDTVVWDVYPSTGVGRDIYIWRPGDAQPTRITSGSVDYNYFPDVSGNRVVWEGEGEIYTWVDGDLAPVNISNTPDLYESYPRISGDRVVWLCEDPDGSGVYTWSVGDSAPTKISDWAGSVGGSFERPAVSGDRVVWSGLHGNASDVFTAVPVEHPYSVTLPPTGIRLDFESVTDSGASFATASTGHAATAGFRILRNGYYDITTTASFTGFVTITIPYDESDLSGVNESNLKLMHWKNNGWEDITVSVDTVNNTITGRTDSFSPFAVMAPTAGASVSTPASSSWSLALVGVVGIGVVIWSRRRRQLGQ